MRIDDAERAEEASSLSGGHVRAGGRWPVGGVRFGVMFEEQQRGIVGKWAAVLAPGGEQDLRQQVPPLRL
ncbi:MAG: hypothetical protein M3Q31_01905 [Actinomycetota bacterium]|nr:hypothetical protein [Actinomycetota bacterium]